MIFQGDVNDIDHHSATGELVNNSNESLMSAPSHVVSGLAARAMQELRTNGQQEGAPLENGTTRHLQPDQSSSRLTDMLHGVSPNRSDSNGDFRANCPSAVPSPLHKVLVGRVPMQPMDPLVRSPEPLRLPFTPKTIDDHFYMTNEHLDVMGKSSWDHVETVRKELLESSNHMEAKVISTIETQVQELKVRIDSAHEKADRATEQSHDIHTKVEELVEYIKRDVMGAFAAQNKQLGDLDRDIKELHKTVNSMQQLLEQKQSENKTNQQNASTTLTPLPNPHSQTSLAGYYGNLTESGREGQSQVQHMPEHRISGHMQDPHNDPRTGYSGNYGQQWAPRAGYQGRGSKDDRPYSATNPYTFANGSANSTQYSGGYSGYSYN